MTCGAGCRFFRLAFYALSWPGETAHSSAQDYQNAAEQCDLGTEWLAGGTGLGEHGQMIRGGGKQTGQVLLQTADVTELEFPCENPVRRHMKQLAPFSVCVIPSF